MRYSFKPSFSRAIALLGLFGFGLAQVGCAHPVVVKPSVVIHSRVGHAPLYAQVGVPAPVWVIPPPRVIDVPRVYGPAYGPAHGWGRGDDRRYERHHNFGHSYQDRRPPAHSEGGRYRRGEGHR